MSAPAEDAALDAFAARVRAALAAPEGSSLAAIFPAPLMTALVVDANEAVSGPWLTRALVEVRDALERVGVPRGRQFALVGRGEAGPALDLRACAAALRDRLSLTVLAHSATGAAFTPGWLATGEAVELDDELREAEAIVCVGLGEAVAGRVDGGPYLLVPGVASLATRGALREHRDRGGERGALAFALAAETLAPVDLALTWDRVGGRVRAGSGRVRFASLAREAGFA